MRVLICVLLVIGVAYADKYKCEPGKIFMNDCNTCACPINGDARAALCTRIACKGISAPGNEFKLPTQPASEALLREKRHSDERCEPGKIFKIDCNTCSCPINGDARAALCTRIACKGISAPGNEFKLPTQPASEALLREKRHSDERCEPGKIFTIDCNTCFCPINGDARAAACTRMACKGISAPGNEFKLPTQPASEALLREKRQTDERCEPGKIFKIDCNTCSCPLNGDARNAFCTRMACNGISSPGNEFKLPSN